MTMDNVAIEAADLTVRAIYSGEGTAKLAADNQVGRVFQDPVKVQQYEARLREQGILGEMILTGVNDRREIIDMGGNGDGKVDRLELRRYIDGQMRLGVAGDKVGVFVAQRALKVMERTGSQVLTDRELGSASGKAQPEAAAMQRAGQQYDGLKTVMRSLNPQSVEDGAIRVGELKKAIAKHPERFTASQLAAAKVLLDPENLPTLTSDKTDIGVRAAWNWVYAGDDKRFLDPEKISARAAELGALPLEKNDRRKEVAASFNAQMPEPPAPSLAERDRPAPKVEPVAVPGEALARVYAPTNDIRFSEYTTKAGDTLWHIAREFLKTSSADGQAPTATQITNFYMAIARENGMADPNILIQGVRLKIPTNYQDIINGAKRSPSS